MGEEVDEEWLVMSSVGGLGEGVVGSVGGGSVTASDCARGSKMVGEGASGIVAAGGSSSSMSGSRESAATVEDPV